MADTNVSDINASKDLSALITIAMRRAVSLCVATGIKHEDLFDSTAPHDENMAIARRLLADLDLLRERMRDVGLIGALSCDGVTLEQDDTPEGL